MPRTNFVLIDFENVQPKDLALLVGGPYKIKVFVGAKQTKIPVELVQALQPFGSDADYIQISGTKKDALDFHIAYYIGVFQSPDTFFHIISGDTGFDPLIKHLKEKNVFCHRSATIADIPLLKNAKPAGVNNIPATTKVAPTKKTSKPELTSKVSSVIEKLAGLKASKPQKLKTLKSTIRAHLPEKLCESDLEHLINILVQQNTIKVSGEKVTYT